MDEEQLQRKVGDRAEREDRVEQLLKDKVQRVEYGPLELTVNNREGVVSAVDFDGRQYPYVSVDWDASWDEIIPEVTDEVDELVEQVFEEL